MTGHGIHRREGFVSPQECAIFVRMLEQYESRHLVERVPGAPRLNIPSQRVAADGFLDEARLLGEVRKRCWLEVMSAFRPPEPIYIDFSLFTVSYLGDKHVRHADNEKFDPDQHRWVPNHTPYRSYSVLVYLNSHGKDFEGGELYLPNSDLTIRPRAGMLIAFPANRFYEHEVLPVTRGKRFALPMWFTGDQSRQEQFVLPQPAPAVAAPAAPPQPAAGPGRLTTPSSPPASPAAQPWKARPPQRKRPETPQPAPVPVIVRPPAELIDPKLGGQLRGELLAELTQAPAPAHAVEPQEAWEGWASAKQQDA
jgi:hypothetical protein